MHIINISMKKPSLLQAWNRGNAGFGEALAERIGSQCICGTRDHDLKLISLYLTYLLDFHRLLGSSPKESVAKQNSLSEKDEMPKGQ